MLAVVLFLCIAGMSVYDSMEAQDQQIARIIGKVRVIATNQAHVMNMLCAA
jgi:hypothetical protein